MGGCCSLAPINKFFGVAPAIRYIFIQRRLMTKSRGGGDVRSAQAKESLLVITTSKPSSPKWPLAGITKQIFLSDPRILSNLATKSFTGYVLQMALIVGMPKSILGQ
jgi:hypothetical protein